ncbi:MAG TPA: hypothetical protein PL066_00710 [bacterium]|nr:hypothetical protein [bacterium]
MSYWKNQVQKTRSWFVGVAVGVLLLVFLAPILVMLFLFTDQGGFFPPQWFCGSDGVKHYCYNWVSAQYPNVSDKSNAVAWFDPKGGDGYCLDLGETLTGECWRFSRKINIVVSPLIVFVVSFLLGAGVTRGFKGLFSLGKKNNK